MGNNTTDQAIMELLAQGANAIDAGLLKTPIVECLHRREIQNLTLIQRE
jgi:hypothetical protein